jgi:hypothetical protein
MALFLYKPHVAGPEGNITTPDIVIDRLFVDGKVKPLGGLTIELAHEVDGDQSPRAGYAITALGGGALISPALCLGDTVAVARSAWRVNNLDGHIGAVSLNGTPLSEVGLPSQVIEAAGGSSDTLPRGYMLICQSGFSDNRAELLDNAKNRSLIHRLFLSDVNADRWGESRPKPRYSVGPTQKEIPHFI